MIFVSPSCHSSLFLTAVPLRNPVWLTGLMRFPRGEIGTTWLQLAYKLFIWFSGQHFHLELIEYNVKWKTNNITPLLNELHWLPVKFRCEYKIATLAYCHFNGTLPFTFQLSSARIRLHALSNHRTKISWKSLNAISSLLATVLSVSLPQLFGIHCLPACPAQHFPFSTGISTNLGGPWCGGG